MIFFISSTEWPRLSNSLVISGRHDAIVKLLRQNFDAVEIAPDADIVNADEINDVLDVIDEQRQRRPERFIRRMQN